MFYEAIGFFHTHEEVDNYPHWHGARPGDSSFRDVNGDGVIDADDRVRMNKTGTPKWNGGMSIRMSYKAFDFTALIQGAAGAVQYIRTESGDFGNYFKEFEIGRASCRERGYVSVDDGSSTTTAARQ